MKQILSLLCCFSFFIILHAQQTVPPQVQQQAREELKRRGIDESEVRTRLMQRGIDLDNVTPEQLPSLQPTLEAVIQEIEQEKAAAANQQTRDTSSLIEETVEDKVKELAGEKVDGLQQAVRGGATPEEAIAEALTDEVTEDLPPNDIYGHHIFRNQSLAVYRTTNEVKPPDSYILGAGDEINISIFGASQADLQLEIGDDGFISPSSMPRIYLKGITYGDAKELLRRRFAQFYVFRTEQFALSINTARVIMVNIFGETEKNGSFSISAVNTAFNALVAAGGPTQIGSVRNIKLMRGGTTRQLDVYDFITNPTVQFDYYLENNDILFVPLAEKIVRISGAVKRPTRYELLEGENLFQLLEYAGGLKNNAYTRLIQLRRLVDNEMVLFDIDMEELNRTGGDYPLQNGDEIEIKTVPGDYRKFAAISGPVNYPGEYALDDNMRISTLLTKGQLQKEARTDVAFLIRRNPDSTSQLIKLDLQAILKNPGGQADLLLEEQDRLNVFPLSTFTDLAEVSVSGAVRNPITTAFDPNETITIYDLLLLGGGLLPNAEQYGYIQRVNPANSNEMEYIKVDIGTAFSDANAPANISLKPFDELIVYTRERYSDISEVQVRGAVRSPGDYRYTPSLLLRDVLTMAGGLRLEAASNRIDIFRVDINKNQPTTTFVTTLTIDEDFNITSGADPSFQLQPFDQIVVRTVPEFELQRSVRIEGEVRYPGDYALLQNNEPLSSLIQRSGGLSPEAFPTGATLYRQQDSTGFVVINLSKALSQPNSVDNIVLQQGDLISVPKTNSLVTIRAANTRASELYTQAMLESGKINVAFQGAKSARWYINEYAVGLGVNGSRKRISVESPNGQFKRTKNFGLFKVYPKVETGSIIAVGAKPPKKERPDRPERQKDWKDILAESIAATTSIISLILLIDRL